MTVAYNTVGRLRPFGFARLLFRYTASIWKAGWVELLIWLVAYFILSILYRLNWGTDSESKRTFESIIMDWKDNNSVVPVTFVLGFYTSITYTRWWTQFEALVWIDPISFALNTILKPPSDEASPARAQERLVIMKRTLVRFLNLASALVLQSSSQDIAKKFPDLRSLATIGLITNEEEHEILASPHNTHPYFIPMNWAFCLLGQAEEEGMIRSPVHTALLIEKFETYRQKLSDIINYKWIPVPLLFTQVVTAAVYFHVLAAIVAEQFVDPSMKHPKFSSDWYVPIFAMMRIITLLGWLKASELMKSPFGQDDDALPVEWIMRRNTDVGPDIVTRCRVPTPTRDLHFENRTPAIDLMRNRDNTQVRRRSNTMQLLPDFGLRSDTEDNKRVRNPNDAMQSLRALAPLNDRDLDDELATI